MSKEIQLSFVTHEKYVAEHSRRIISIKDGLVESDTQIENSRIPNGVREELTT